MVASTVYSFLSSVDFLASGNLSPLLNNLESVLKLIFTSEASGLCSILNEGNTCMIVGHCQCLVAMKS